MTRTIPPSASTGEFEHVTLEEVNMEEITPADSAELPSSSGADARAAQPAGEAAASATDNASGFLGLWGASSPPAAAAGQPGSAAPGDSSDPLKELEEAAAKVADQARHAAKAASFKLKEGAAELAANLTSWWSTLEPGNQFALPGVSTQSKHQDYAAIQEQLGLDAGEAILESFACQLLQAYTCTNNPFTPDRQVAFGGELHITSQRVCFVVHSEKGLDPVKLELAAIKQVKKEPAGAGLPERLVLSLSGDGSQSLVLSKFALKELEMDSALALLEHLTTE